MNSIHFNNWTCFNLENPESSQQADEKVGGFDLRGVKITQTETVYKTNWESM